MSRPGRVVRLLVAAVLLTILLVAQLRGHDDWFPLGTLGQYAVARDPDGEVVSTYVLGRDATGATFPVTLRAGSAGITRVELEIALGDLQEDPAPLAAVAEAVEQDRPGTDVVALEVRQLVHTLRDGGRAGPPLDRLVLTWEEP